MRAAMLGSLLIAGCAYATVDSAVRPAQPLEAGVGIWVLTPEDGAYGGRPYAGSGRTVARRVLASVRKRYPLAQTAATSDEAAALRQAPSAGVKYLVSPVILHWEDRATPWSGFRDKVRVELRVLETRPVQLVARTAFESRNNSISFIDGRPEDLLDHDFDEAIDALLISSR